MKIILKQSVPKVGKEGQVVTVKGGYARNYLFPRGMAVLAEKGQLKALEARNAKLQAKLDETKAGAEAIKDKLDGQTLEIKGKVGKETGRLFGAVTDQDIVDAIKSTFGANVEKKAVLLAHPIKTLGRHTVEIDVHRQVDIRLTVVVFDPEAVKEEKPATMQSAPKDEPEQEPITAVATEQEPEQKPEPTEA